MSEAYDATLKTLKLDRSESVTQLIAKKIIEIAQTNERDPARISALVIKELDIPIRQ